MQSEMILNWTSALFLPASCLPSVFSETTILDPSFLDREFYAARKS